MEIYLFVIYNIAFSEENKVIISFIYCLVRQTFKLIRIRKFF